MTESSEISIKRNSEASSWEWVRKNALVIVGILSVIGSSTYFIITFYIRSSDSWGDVKNLQEEVKQLKETINKRFDEINKSKADLSTVDANQKNTVDRLQRQYEQNNTRDARITDIEKKAAYEEGKHDAMESYIKKR